MTASFTSPFTLTATSSGTGPVAAGNFINVDFGANPSTGAQTIAQSVWGVASGALNNSSFAPFADATLQGVLLPLAFPFLRLHCDGQQLERAFPNGATTADAAHLSDGFDTLINNFPLCFPMTCRLVIGLGDPPTNWSSPSNYAAACKVAANYLNTKLSTANNQPLPVWGFELFGNELNGSEGTLAPYFNAAAVAVKQVNSNYKACGPVFSFADNLAQFARDCRSNCDAIDYHAYAYAPGEFAGKGGIDFILNTQFDQSGARSDWVSGGGSSSTEILLGEYNQNNTCGTISSSTTGGGCVVDSSNVNMQTIVGAVFNANVMLGCVNSDKFFTMAGIWECYQDSDYGLIGGADNSGGNYTVNPGGWFLSKAAATLFGTRVAVSPGTTNPALNTLAVKGSSTAGNMAVMLINGSRTNSFTGQVALSRWPVNNTGNGTINLWTISPAHPSGQLTTVAVNTGITASITVPAESVVILYS